MLEYLKYLVFIVAAVQVIGILPYIKEVLQGKTKPNKVSWFMWSVAPLIATAAGLVGGVGWTVLPVFMSGFIPLIVFIISLLDKKSYWKLEIFDYICGLFSVLALILWGITKNPSVAIIFAILSDGSAALPTLIKSWKFPETENVMAYASGIFNAATSFTAIAILTFSALAFPIYLVVANSTISYFIIRGSLIKKLKKV